VLQFRALAKPLRFHGQYTELNVEKLPGQIRMPLGQFTGMDLVGPVRLTTRSRDVVLTDVTNSVEISVDRGDIELRPGKVPLARIDAHTRNGQIELSIPPSAKFDITATATRGDISNDYGGGLRQENDRRTGTLRGSIGTGGPTINIQTEHGSITVRRASTEDTTGSAATPTIPEPSKPAKALKPIDQ
jgi:DUF4097 and DUF4098 domain-containing protein YvlB